MTCRVSYRAWWTITASAYVARIRNYPPRRPVILPTAYPDSAYAAAADSPTCLNEHINASGDHNLHYLATVLEIIFRTKWQYIEL